MSSFHSSILQLFEDLPVAVYTTDNEGYINFYNDSAAELWEAEPEIGKDRWCGWHKIYELDGKTLVPSEKCPLALLILKGQPNNNKEWLIETKTGKRKYVVPHPQLLLDENGKRMGALNLVIDNTAKRLIEDTEARFEAIIKNSTDAIVSKTLDGIITSWNKSAERIFGFSEAEMIGQHISKLIPPDRFTEEVYILQKIRKGERVDTFETQRFTKFGDIIDISLTVSPIKNKKGEIIGASKIVRDVTRQKILQNKVEESELLLRTITNTSPAALWLTNSAGKILFFSQTWLRWTGSSFDEQLNNGWLNSIYDEDRVQVSEQFSKAFEARADFSSEFRMQAADGTLHWYSSEGHPYNDNNGVFGGYTGSITEITNLKEIEKRKDDFIVMASHELKTPITSISGYVQLLSNIFDEKVGKGSEGSLPFVRTSLSTIERQVTKLTRLISELLDLSRIQTNQMDLKKSYFSVHDLVQEIMDEARHTTQKHRLHFECDYKGMIYADRDRVGQMLSNLISNAIKYSKPDTQIEVTCKRENGNVILTVCDQGIGIPEEEQPRIFERFYRGGGKVEQTYPGFGIGLFIAHEIVERHDGSIKVESHSGKGTIFTVTLPIGISEN